MAHFYVNSVIYNLAVWLIKGQPLIINDCIQWNPIVFCAQISQHWFRQWLGDEQAANHCLNRNGPVHRYMYASPLTPDFNMLTYLQII